MKNLALRAFVLSALSAYGASAGAADCAAYTRQALSIVSDITALFTSTLQSRVQTNDLRCEFTGPIWSNREQRHMDWCNGPPAQAQGAIDQRLKQMSDAVQACKGDTAPRLAAAKQSTPPTTNTSTSASTSSTTTSTTSSTSSTAATATSSGSADCPTALAELVQATGVRRCNCTPAAMKAAPPPMDRSEFSMETSFSICQLAVMTGMIAKEGGVIQVGGVSGNGGPADFGDSGAPTAMVTMRGGSGVSSFSMRGDRAPTPPPPPAGDDDQLIELSSAKTSGDGSIKFVPPNPDLAIKVVAATFGGNCAGVSPGNQTPALTEECDGMVEHCEYQVDATALRDPAPGCAKTYVAEWTCGKDPKRRRAEAKPRPGMNGKAGDMLVQLDCGD